MGLGDGVSGGECSREITATYKCARQTALIREAAGYACDLTYISAHNTNTAAIKMRTNYWPTAILMRSN